jgi:hypothetical protein
MCILSAYKLFLKFSSEYIHPNYFFYCFECCHRVCPNLSPAPCMLPPGTGNWWALLLAGDEASGQGRHPHPLHQSWQIMDEWTIKTQNPLCWLIFKIYLLTDFAAGHMFNRVYRLEIHSFMVGIFDPACALLPPCTKKLFLCTVAPRPSLLPPPPPLPKVNIQYV